MQDNIVDFKKAANKKKREAKKQSDIALYDALYAFRQESLRNFFSSTDGVDDPVAYEKWLLYICQLLGDVAAHSQACNPGIRVKLKGLHSAIDYRFKSSLKRIQEEST